MLTDHLWLRYSDNLEKEVLQLEDEGRTVTDEMIKKTNEIVAMEAGNAKEAAAIAFFDYVKATSPENNTCEPSDLKSIQDLAKGNAVTGYTKDDALLNKVLGGWLGRASGCLLGKPVECWKRERILGLKAAIEGEREYYGGYMLFGNDTAINEKFEMDKNGSWIDLIKCMPEDDDTNYTVIGMRVIEKYGRDFDTWSIAECWLCDLPILHTCTAERVAYRNIVTGKLPPESAVYCNPMREWIGAQIRADAFGYANPGDCKTAADMAWRDASMTHVKNGIYGEMWVAAMIAKAFVCDDIKEVIRAGLNEIPPQSRLHVNVEKVIGQYESGMSWKKALELIHEQWDENDFHHWCHTVANAMIVVAALLWGEKDLEKTISIAVMAALDTDCNGATSGSVLGVMLGAKALPENWIKPMNNTLITGVDGIGKITFTELAERCMKLIV